MLCVFYFETSANEPESNVTVRAHTVYRNVTMSFFSFGQSAEIDVVLNDAETRKKAEHKTEDGKKDKYFLFYDGETVSGKVNVTLKNPGKRLEHQGIKIEFVGQIGRCKIIIIIIIIIIISNDFMQHINTVQSSFC